MLLLALALLPACSDKGDPHPGDSGDGGGAGDGGGPYDCGELAEAHEVSTTAWTVSAHQPKASQLMTVVQDPLTGSLFAGSSSAGTWRSDDGGETWRWMMVEITHTIAELYVPVGHAGEVLRSKGGTLQQTLDNGETWQTLTLGMLDPTKPSKLVMAIAGAGYEGDRVYAFTSDGQAWVSEDDAQTFTAASMTTVGPAMDPYMHLHFMGYRMLGDPAPGDAILIASPQAVIASWNGMGSWTTVLTGSVVGQSLARDPVDPQHLVVASSGGTLHHSWDGGATWDDQAVDLEVRSATFSPDGRLLFLVGADAVLRSEDQGATFTRLPATFDTPSASFVDLEGRLYVTHDEGIDRSDDDGASFRSMLVGLDDLGMSPVATHPVCPDRLFVGSRCSGGLFESADWGQGWSHVNGTFHYVMAMHYDPHDPDRVWVVSDDALWVRRGEDDWELSYLEYHFHGFAVHPEDPDTLLLGSVGSGEYADDAGHVYRSTDGGVTWTDSSAGLPDNDASMHTLLFWPDDPSIVLLGTFRGGGVSHPEGEGIGMFRSTDGGTTWSAVDLAPTEIAWLTEGPDGAVAATSDGIWHSADGGRSWTRYDGPTGFMLGVDFLGDTGLAIEQTGRSWITRDGGASWTELPPDPMADSSNTLAAVAIAADGRMAWKTRYNYGLMELGLE